MGLAAEGEPVLTGNETVGQVITNEDGNWEVFRNDAGELNVALQSGSVGEVVVTGDYCLG